MKKITQCHSEPRQRFAKNLRTLRRLRNLSQEALANDAGVSRVYLGEVERGNRAVTIDVMGKLAATLNVDITILLSKQFLQDISKNKLD